MNILYTCDNNYIWLMGISMISLFENNKMAADITVYLLGESISEENREILRKIAFDYQRKCIVINMTDIDIPESLITTRWPKSAFSRLYSAKLLPQNVDKVLYLDCDTIILCSLDELEKINMEKYPVYGVMDCIGLSYRKNIGLDKNSFYINAGVLFLNLNLLRMIDVSELIENFLKKYHKTIHYADQDVLNGMFKGRFGILPPEYDVMTLQYMYSYADMLTLRHPINYYSQKKIEYAVKNPKIIHFTTCMLNVRPWFQNSNHPMADKFLEYKEMSPWKNRILEKINKNSGLREKVLMKIHLLPHRIEMGALGLIHAIIYPRFLRFKAIMH